MSRSRRADATRCARSRARAHGRSRSGAGVQRCRLLDTASVGDRRPARPPSATGVAADARPRHRLWSRRRHHSIGVSAAQRRDRRHRRRAADARPRAAARAAPSPRRSCAAPAAASPGIGATTWSSSADSTPWCRTRRTIILAIREISGRRCELSRRSRRSSTSSTFDVRRMTTSSTRSRRNTPAVSRRCWSKTSALRCAPRTAPTRFVRNSEPLGWQTPSPSNPSVTVISSYGAPSPHPDDQSPVDEAVARLDESSSSGSVSAGERELTLPELSRRDAPVM
jgi:hypothetical protein